MTDFLVGFLCGAVAFVPIPVYCAFTRTVRNAVERSTKTVIAIHFGQLSMLPLLIGGMFLVEAVLEHMGPVTPGRTQIALFGYIFGMAPNIVVLGWQELAWRKKNPSQHPPPQRRTLSILALCAVVGIVVVGVLAQKTSVFSKLPHWTPFAFLVLGWFIIMRSIFRKRRK